MGKWVEHYLDLYSMENKVSEEALDSIQALPVLLELNAEPTSDKLEKTMP